MESIDAILNRTACRLQECRDLVEDLFFSIEGMEAAVKSGNKEVEGAKKSWRESSRGSK